MLYAIAQELDANLRAQGVPFPVVFGPEATASTTAARERIVLEQPIDEKRDSIGPAKATHPNPRMPLIRLQAARVRIFARSSLAGAAWHDHAERAEEVLDHVLAELDFIVRGRKNTLTVGASGFVSLADAHGSSVWSGAVYEFDLAVDRGIFRRTWAGDAREEVVIGTDVTLVSTTKVNNATGTMPNGAETASGG
jgi:hypothetical protein